ncbi:ATP-binding cassette domain-containing protein [Arthrobacter sp. JZ12]|uniref:ABC transporter ATP-binding protein n=1 Tax=Arthrobacter sp. JZ12 TaxID=2654190 RepID=UPI002B468DAA|nr:ABC transporter ATP-binding protein [Arthrobacter sp. JZ12]WRH25861.1 ATP-binding cassette domain-containing protein [Arthrobacter sp. JZ12]
MTTTTLDSARQQTAPVLASANAVTKSFAGNPALDGVTLQIRAGESVGLLGPNGAGKSTLISLLAGLRRPDAGSVRLFDGDPSSPRTRLRLGITPQATAVPQNLTVGEAVRFVAGHYPDPVPAGQLLEDFGLTAIERKQCGGLSGGQQRRLLVALALVGRPELVILDEPTTGLDVDARETLWAQLREYRRSGGTLLITSHYLEEIQALANRVVVIDRGTVIADGTVDQIRSRVAVSKVSFETGLPASSFLALPGAVDAATAENGRTTVVTQDADATVRELVVGNLPFGQLEVHAATLEEAFRAITAQEKP